MDQAELEIAAKMLGGVAYKGGLFTPKEPKGVSCRGCAFDNRTCSEFLDKAERVRQLRCQGLIWIKQNLK